MTDITAFRATFGPHAQAISLLADLANDPTNPLQARASEVLTCWREALATPQQIAMVATSNELEVDDAGACVSLGESDGYFIQTWTWVEYTWDGPTDSDGAPANIVNRYHCDDCDTSWEDQWSCACNDKCPQCGHEIEPDESVELSLFPAPGSV